MSTRRTVFAFVTAGHHFIGPAVDVPKDRRQASRFEPADLSWLYDETRTLARGLAEAFPPTTVWIEQPVGASPKPGLMAAWGAVIAGVQAALADPFPFPVPVYVMTPPTWKKRALGRGNAGKPEIMDWARALVGDALEDQDAADALGVAVAGRRSVLES